MSIYSIKRPSKEILENLYIYENMSFIQLANEYNVTVKSISNWVKFYNLTKSIKLRSEAIRRNKDNIPENFEWLFFNFTRKELAKSLNVSQDTIKKWARKNGLRKTSEQVFQKINERAIKNYGLPWAELALKNLEIPLEFSDIILSEKEIRNLNIKFGLEHTPNP